MAARGRPWSVGRSPKDRCPRAAEERDGRAPGLLRKYRSVLIGTIRTARGTLSRHEQSRTKPNAEGRRRPGQGSGGSGRGPGTPLTRTAPSGARVRPCRRAAGPDSAGSLASPARRDLVHEIAVRSRPLSGSAWLRDHRHASSRELVIANTLVIANIRSQACRPLRRRPADGGVRRSKYEAQTSCQGSGHRRERCSPLRSAHRAPPIRALALLVRSACDETFMDGLPSAAAELDGPARRIDSFTRS
jgi:hypothetical protein